MKLNSVAAAALLAFAGVQAHATTFNLGTLTGSRIVGNSFAAQAGSFTDLYHFNVGSASDFSGVAIALNFDIPFLRGVEFSISDLSISLTDGNTGAVYTDRYGHDGFSLSALIGPGASHAFSINGFVNGNWGGAYAAELSVTPAAVSPIPEPSTYALMLAGLGVVGFVASRRRPHD